MTCGFAVEWVRNAKTSKWRLFAGHPEITTAGVYLRVPLDRPHFPWPHFFGSIDWTPGDRPFDSPDLGELPGFARWCNGVPGGSTPPAAHVGDPSCFGSGDVYPPAPGRTLHNGFDGRCWLVPAVEAPPNPMGNIQERDIQIALATVEALLYTDPGAAVLYAQQILPGATVTIVPNGPGPWPGSIIAVHPSYTVVWVSGTTNPGQFALQAMYADGGPVNYGPFSTNPVWWGASNILHSRIVAAGADPEKPILFVGHSYGAAVATVTAGRYTVAERPGQVQILAFGSPKPGDARLQELINGLNTVYMVTFGDPVAFMPPTADDVKPIVPPPPFSFVFAWEGFVRPSGLLLLTPAGELKPVNPGDLGLAQLISTIGQAVTGAAFSVPSAHDMSTYITWLKR